MWSVGTRSSRGERKGGDDGRSRPSRGTPRRSAVVAPKAQFGLLKRGNLAHRHGGLSYRSEVGEYCPSSKLLWRRIHV